LLKFAISRLDLEIAKVPDQKFVIAGLTRNPVAAQR
jgi:hypothetical protein